MTLGYTGNITGTMKCPYHDKIISISAGMLIKVPHNCDLSSKYFYVGSIYRMIILNATLCIVDPHEQITIQMSPIVNTNIDLQRQLQNDFLGIRLGKEKLKHGLKELVRSNNEMASSKLGNWTGFGFLGGFACITMLVGAITFLKLH